MHPMIRFGCIGGLLLLASCSTPPKQKIPALTPETAAELLHYNSKAETWLIHVKRQDPSCEYRLDLPDQTTQPTEIDLQHIVYCGNRPSSMENDASVSFSYDKDTQKWTVLRFSD